MSEMPQRIVEEAKKQLKERNAQILEDSAGSGTPPSPSFHVEQSGSEVEVRMYLERNGVVTQIDSMRMRQLNG